jgi:hypothetical protein
MSDEEKPSTARPTPADQEAKALQEARVLQEAEKSAGIYAWNYFQYHAGQRQSVFRFYLTLIGATTIAYAYSQRVVESHKDAMAIAEQLRPLVGGVFLACSLLFWRLDNRSRSLIKLSEDALKTLEVRLAKAMQDKDRVIELMRRGDVVETGFPKSEIATFHRVYGCIFLLIGIIGAFLIHRYVGYSLSTLAFILYIRDLRYRYRAGKVHFGRK